MTEKTQSQKDRAALVAATALIAGNLVGAGILGLPINTGLAGMVPSLCALLAGGLLMGLTALILGDEVFRRRNEKFDYPSLYEDLLGRGGKWVATAANLVILYGLLTAYFTGGAKIVAGLFSLESSTVVLLLFALPLVVLASVELGFLARLNILFIALLVVFFSGLLLMGLGHVEMDRFAYSDWTYLIATLPIVITAFHFHNVIPTVGASLGWDRTLYRKALFAGMALAFVMNILWVFVGIGVIPLTGADSILAAWETNMPATVPMAAQIGGSLFPLCAAFFALVAIATSFLANGLGLQSFIGDLLSHSFGLESRPLILGATFLPPLLISVVYPDIFLRALDVVGGVGIVVLFALLPLLLVLRDRKRAFLFRFFCLVAFLFALLILSAEMLQETGLLELAPHVEYHRIDF